MKKKLKRGKITTISISPNLKKRINKLKGDQTYQKFLADLLREEVIDFLEAYRAPGETYGDVIANAARTPRRSEDELEALIESGLRDLEVDGTTVKVKSLAQEG